MGIDISDELYEDFRLGLIGLLNLRHLEFELPTAQFLEYDRTSAPPIELKYLQFLYVCAGSEPAMFTRYYDAFIYCHCIHLR